MGKLISILSLIAAVAAALAAQFEAIKPLYGQIALLIAAAAGAAGSALSKASDNQAATVIGVLIAVSTAALSFTDVLPPLAVQILGIIAVGFTAAGRSLFGDVFGEDKK